MKQLYWIVLASMFMCLGGLNPGRAQEEIVFIFGRPADGLGLDGAVSTDGESFRVLNQGCESLFAFDGSTTNVVPSLAESYEVSDDNLTWMFNLRENVLFQDGTPFNASAVKFNIDRWRLTDNPYHFADKVFEYWEALFGGFDDQSIVSDVTVVDDNTVTITLRQPLAPLLTNFAIRTMFGIHSPTAIMEYGPAYGTPGVGYVCTGPYKFVEWVDGRITLERFEGYWGEVDGNVDRIVFVTIPDNAARYAALLNGEIDGMEQANIEDLQNVNEQTQIYILTRPALNTFYLAFNFRIREFQDVRIRRAISLAINRQQIVDTFYGGYAQVANNFLPPSVWGYNEDVNAPTQDLDAARQLLTDAGFPDGMSQLTLDDGTQIPFILYYMPVVRFYNPDPEGVALAVANYLADIGIQAQLDPVGDWTTYLTKSRNGELQGIWQLGWNGDNGDPDNFLCYFFCNSDLPREGFYNNEALNELLRRASVLPNQSDRQPLYEEAESILADDVARIFIAHNQTPLLFRNEVSGYLPNPVGSELFSHITLTR